MYHVRTTKTASFSTAVQVVRYENRKLIVVAHIGSAHTTKEVNSLKRTAYTWIEKISKKQSLFPVEKHIISNLISLEKCRYLGFRYHFIYEVLTKICIRFAFHALRNNLLIDLLIIRIVEPSSKLQALKLLKELFGVKHLRKHFYEDLSYIIALKDQAEACILAIAKKELNFNFSLVFYDVTTLYFETFREDGFRKHGFSKDNKANQPQILIGLLVNTHGFPVAYHVFPGNKFEGHTLIPVISSFKRKHKIDSFTVVADAAMISFDNIKALEDNKLHYI